MPVLVCVCVCVCRTGLWWWWWYYIQWLSNRCSVSVCLFIPQVRSVKFKKLNMDLCFSIYVWIHKDTHTETHKLILHLMLLLEKWTPNKGYFIMFMTIKFFWYSQLLQNTLLTWLQGYHIFPWRRKWPPPPVLLSGQSHGRRTPAGYNSAGCKQSDMTDNSTGAFPLPFQHEMGSIPTR